MNTNGHSSQKTNAKPTIGVGGVEAAVRADLTGYWPMRPSIRSRNRSA